MGELGVKTIDVKGMEDSTLQEFMQESGISLRVEEARRIVKLIGRNPSLTELHIFNIQWSEHTSYKSSKSVLKTLPTNAPNVILGPVEDSGIVELGEIEGERYGIVMTHESHNHPSQVVPFEGAATGIGGVLRDVICMGAKIVATADPLRFGNPFGRNKNRVRYIANEVINGIASYGNAVGIPNLAGDVYFNESFDDNCLVNVVCLGIIKEKDIIHSSAPPNSEEYDVIVVGKATDDSGFGGASFASLILDEEDQDINKRAVQVPDPFLKNMLIRATYRVFEESRKNDVMLGFKDMGAGGIMCAISELCQSGGYGCDIDLDRVHVSIKDMPPFVIVTSETQERFAWISPKEFTPKILKIYNEDFELPHVAEGARASVIGRVTRRKKFLLRYNGEIVCNVPIDVVTSGIKYERERKKKRRNFKEPEIPEPSDYNRALLEVLNHPNIASKARVYKHYDTEVLGCAVIRPGEADAGVMTPVHQSSYGIALSVDSNPAYCRINPYMGSVNAVAEAMRNVAAVGAVPSALTDCLCFGNPENPEVFDDFCETIRGIKEAAEHLKYKGKNHPVPVISGNVSFYNESASGKAVDPSPIIACVGILKDYRKAIAMQIKEKNSLLFMVGERKDELGGSVYYELNKEIGKNIPAINFEKERCIIYGVIDCIYKGLFLSCHDISDGGMAVTISEMILGGEADGKIGAEIFIDFSPLPGSKSLFSESSGFVFEVNRKNAGKVKKIFDSYRIDLIEIGKTLDEQMLIIKDSGKELVNLSIDDLRKAWVTGYVEAVK